MRFDKQSALVVGEPTLRQPEILERAGQRLDHVGARLLGMVDHARFDGRLDLVQRHAVVHEAIELAIGDQPRVGAGRVHEVGHLADAANDDRLVELVTRDQRKRLRLARQHDEVFDPQVRQVVDVLDGGREQSVHLGLVHQTLGPRAVQQLQPARHAVASGVR